jgi:hypothetical protein
MKQQGLFQRLFHSAFRPAGDQPDFIILGARGPDINWLSRQLNAHRGVSLSAVREPQQVPAIMQNEMGGALGGLGSRVFGKFFSGHPITKGMISQSYAFSTEASLRAIQLYAPEAVMVMVVRNPLQTVLHSVRHQASRKRAESFSALDWQKLCDNPTHYEWTNYSTIIPLWDEIFGEKILYLPYDLKYIDPQEFVRRIVERLNSAILAAQVTNGPKVESTHICIPPQIKMLLAARTKTDADFLGSRFAKDFMSLCQT